MTDIYFVRTSHFYQSYTDLIKLAELSGFPVIKESEVDTSKSGVYIHITMNGDVEAHLRNEVQSGKPRRAHLIQWNIERPDGSAGSLDYFAQRQWQLMHDRLFDEIWVSDARLADETMLRFVVLGSDEGLGEPGEDKNYSFCHLSYEVARRINVYKHFDNRLIGPNCWGDERHEVLKRSKFGLAVHQDRHSFQEPLRLALFAAYGLPVISEDVFDAYPWAEEYAIFVNYANIVGKLKQVLNEDYGPYRDMGLRARDRMTKEFRFKTMVEQAVKESVERWR